MFIYLDGNFEITFTIKIMQYDSHISVIATVLCESGGFHSNPFQRFCDLSIDVHNRNTNEKCDALKQVSFPDEIITEREL